jgi:hypothetical protein
MVVGGGSLGAGFSTPLEEDAAKGAKVRRSLDTLCIFKLGDGGVGGGCGGFQRGGYVGDKGCGDTTVFGVVPLGGRAVVAYMDGRTSPAKTYPAPSGFQLRVAFFFSSRDGVHAVKRVTAYDRSGRRLWTEVEGPHDVTTECD